VEPLVLSTTVLNSPGFAGALKRSAWSFKAAPRFSVAQIKKDSKKWAEVIERAGVKPD
jgi:hypothetical protein